MKYYIYIFILLFSIYFSITPLYSADNTYSGKRWGYSHMTLTKATDLAWSKDGYFIYYRTVADDGSTICRLRDKWKNIRKQDNSGNMKLETVPGDLRIETLYKINAPVKYFVFSPDTTKAAYCIPEGGGYALYILNLATKETRRLTYGMAPSWSPKSDKIAFYFKGSNGRYGIGIINPDGNNFKVLSALDDWSPVWSPDGKSIAFLSARDYVTKGTMDYSNIFVIKLEPYSITQITREKNTWQKNLSWSPIGKKIVYQSSKGVEIADVPPKSIKLVESADKYRLDHAFKPVFSPDGRWIFFRREKGMGLVQHNTFQGAPIEGSAPWWSPAVDSTGKKIVFNLWSESSKAGIWVVEAFDF